jgi:hypothetical protein
VSELLTLSNFLTLTFAIRSGAIDSQVNTRGRCKTDLVNHPLEKFRTIETNQQNRLTAR